MSVEKITSEDARSSSEDPLKEVSALQFLKAHGPHPNVIEVVEVRVQKEACMNTSRSFQVEVRNNSSSKRVGHTAARPLAHGNRVGHGR